MGDLNESTCTNPSRPDEEKWHPDRKLCYHWKREHSYLKDQVDEKHISYNTEFNLDIEHCVVENRDERMSLRSSRHGEDVAIFCCRAALCLDPTRLISVCGY